MFLVEIEAGREALYDSLHAFVAAIRRGEVTPRSRIFHRVSSSWISITLHPEFKKAIAGRGEPLPPLARNRWTFYGVEPRGRQISEAAPAAGVTAASASAAGGTAGPAPAGPRGGWRGLLARVRRGLSPAQRAPETSGS
ncbi:MAG: hypothetical protein H0T50_08080 [Gemmatimonadales bacterium]|nr:hypothetical protein [Gemmatimonadales bacterium]